MEEGNYWNTALVALLPHYLGITFFYTCCDSTLVQLSLRVNQGITEAYTCEEELRKKNKR